MCIGGLSLIIVREAKHSGVYLTYKVCCYVFGGVYLNLATEFIIKLRFRLGNFWEDCSLKGGEKIILEQISNVASA